MNATTNPAAVGYLAAVRDALVDLSADDIADITDELRENLAEVVAELGPTTTMDQLVARLGTPAAYAAELRSAAGIIAVAQVAERGAGFWRRLTRFVVACAIGGSVAALALGAGMSLLSSDGAYELIVLAVVLGVAAVAGALLLMVGVDEVRAELAAIPGARFVVQAREWLRRQSWGDGLVDFLVSLRPAWWIARAAVVALLVAFFIGSPLLGAAVVFAAAVVGSVWLGRRSQRGELDRRGRFGVYALNAGAGLASVYLAAVVVANVGSGAMPVQYVDDEYPSYQEEYAGGDVYVETGQPVTNIFAYGPDGRLLENVRLYDQDGNPIQVEDYGECYEGAYQEETFTQANPWGTNVFPRLTVEVDPTSGECREPKLVAPFGPTLPGSPAETPAPTATPTPATPAPTTPAPTLTPTPAVPPLAPPGS